MAARSQTKRRASNFFIRTFLVLLALTVGASGILMFIGYSFSRNSIEKRTTENVSQQIEIIRDKFDTEHRTNLNRSLKALVNDPVMDDFLRGSEAQKFIIRKHIEARFRQALRDFRSYQSISFVGDDGRVLISARRNDGHSDVLNPESEKIPAYVEPSMRLFRELKAIPLLLSSGNMEWFMPPREVQVQGPFTSKDGSISVVAGIAKLDLDTGEFGGVVMIHERFNDFFKDLREVTFFDENPIWVFDHEGETLQHPATNSKPFSLGKRLPSELQSDTLLLSLDDGLVAFRDFSIVPGIPLFRVMIEIPKELFLKDLSPAIQFFTVVLGISVFVLLTLSLYISRFLSRPFVELQKAEGMLANAQRIAKLGHWQYNPATGNILMSEQAREILELTEAEDVITLRSFMGRIRREDRAVFAQTINKAVNDSGSFSLESGIVRLDGSVCLVRLEIVVEGDLPEREKQVIATIQDISEQKETESKIRHLAYYDEVTGLPNRTLLNDHGEQALASASRGLKHAAILFLDIDHFKKVNDTIGHNDGDELLRQVGQRLRHCVRGSDRVDSQLTHEPPSVPATGGTHTIARLGGDEFIVLLSELRASEDAGVVAARINEAIAERYIVNGKEIYTTCSIGISVYPNDGETTEELLKHADAAMYQAKNSGRNGYAFYSSAIDKHVQARVSLENRLHNAIETDQLRLHYQPKINIATGSIVGMEALLRWVHPTLGLITPDQFISVAEDTGLIIPIGKQVLRDACRQTKIWHGLGFSDLGVSVNISIVQFNHQLIDTIEGILSETGLDAKYLELELTESLLMENVEAGSVLVTKLKDMGTQLSIDDFGTGYSSLSLLKHLPVHALKIDKSFTADLLTDPDDALIVKTTIDLGHSLRLKVVAEGVEHPGQLEFLRNNHCDEAQGYLIGKPMPPEQFTGWFGAQKKAS